MRMSEKELEELINQVEQEGLISAPRHMKQEILEHSRRIDHQLVRETRQTSKNMQLFLYSMKVGAAVITALLILFLTPSELPQMDREIPMTVTWEENVNLGEKMNQGIREANERMGQKIWEWRNLK